MVELIAILALAPALYALWIVGRTDLLRLVQGSGYARGAVVRHELGSDGYVPVYSFERGGATYLVRGPTAHAAPRPAVGSTDVLVFPRRRPDLARPPQAFARTLMYAGFAAWFAFFGDLLFDWF